VQNWYALDDPASARWHYDGCELVLGVDTRNKPIIKRPLIFVGTFETASPSSNDESSHSDFSSGMFSNSHPKLKVSC